MRKRKRKEVLEEPVVNLTPLIDVVFVILFTFIVVAPLLETDRVDLATGSSLDSKKSAEEKSLIAIHVFDDDSIEMNREPLTLEELREHLALAKRSHPNATPQLFHDKRATFGAYQSIKNAVESAGFDQMDVILKPQ